MTALEQDCVKVLVYLQRVDQNEEISSEIAAATGLTLRRANEALDAMRRGGLVVESDTVRSLRDGDMAPVWAIRNNRGWAKVWVLRSAWNESVSGRVLPNGRAALPKDDPEITASFRANWEADD